MSEIATTSSWRPRSAWAGFAKPGRQGRAGAEPGVILDLREGIGLATIILADGQDEALARALSERFGFAPPAPGAAAFASGRGLVWAGPGQWLAVAPSRADLAGFGEALAGLAAVTDQSDSRAVVRVSGPQARTALSKGVGVDLHPRAFRAGSAAGTGISHIVAQIWQLDDAPTYELAVPRSFAGSFWGWLTESAAEYGCEVRGLPR
ncbi:MULTISPECIES: sarcosine oxidase subunit gamma family protein [Methylobacterium]|uniref:Sarcosine oxidase subunit gamma n=3 Tax=Pseudomonadota TaxID=1224 RepID=A0ABQ4STA1_9HYPH|nr:MULTISPECIES: sarcosine oxidase subunit gamma family protein [Methylobacterium]PIU05901.1 MAG: sarcosine oxidase subunit gamma [Methylobacterium sp. CG09_land_8_20_14_0_10_71_15]PIU12731.1 MAG: sarcosine oxidase subunit gamma [Methylobacterium sp. CG08_land_8_20_14_0_20_71_15]GBU18757.1 hypothetical protein AwMethylo_29720 [Methylobacterium sp.]GJE05719.1 hypothetical protein AOPFMNJM_1025 [Methylobacterium jeotgali]